MLDIPAMKFDDEGCVDCAQNAATDVPGVFVAGNASKGLQLVIIAAAEGAQAAFAINQAILDSETARGVCGDETRRVIDSWSALKFFNP